MRAEHLRVTKTVTVHTGHLRNPEQVRFEVDATPRLWVSVYRRFGETHQLHFQGSNGPRRPFRIKAIRPFEMS